MIGMSIGPVTGRLVAQIAAGATLPADVRLLDPDRFGARP
jgi:glycine/D-amino acid oxidase-like deaminating enzyme